MTLLLLSMGTALWAQPRAGNPELADAETYGYLYCHRSEHGGWSAYALSQDGIHFHDLLCGDSVFPAEAPARVEEQVILQQDPSLQIFGTGHNSVLNIPGTDDWYMVYHRFTRPAGIKIGLSGGYNREICIDPLYFNPDGTIIPVKPTL